MELKNKIKKIVNDYKRTHYQDYLAVVQSIKAKASQQDRIKVIGTSNTSEIKGIGGKIEMQPLYELPEDLYNIIYNKLDEEELDKFRSLEFSKWLSKQFKEFSLR